MQGQWWMKSRRGKGGGRWKQMSEKGRNEAVFIGIEDGWGQARLPSAIALASSKTDYGLFNSVRNMRGELHTAVTNVSTRALGSTFAPITKQRENPQFQRKGAGREPFCSDQEWEFQKISLWVRARAVGGHLFTNCKNRTPSVFTLGWLGLPQKLHCRPCKGYSKNARDSVLTTNYDFTLLNQK